MSLSLDKLRETTEKRFTAAEVALGAEGVIKLESLLRLPQPVRKVVADLLTDFNDLPDNEDEDTVALGTEVLEKVIGEIADDPEKLLKALKHPDPLIYYNLLGDVVTHWGNETRLGEAGNSRS